jgi:Ca-activated chloride channel homolog
MLGDFHFDQPWWLLCLLVPIILKLLPDSNFTQDEQDRVNKFADAYLLPYLVSFRSEVLKKKQSLFVVWGIIWSLAVIAMAGPRWDYTDIYISKPATDLVILLDMSRSMDAKDVMPDRFARAKQEIQDLVNHSQDMRIGLVAFATMAHVVTPVTDDKQTLIHMLPALSTNLIKFSGSNLFHGFDVVSQLLLAQPAENSKIILLISDGDFSDQDFPESKIKSKLAEMSKAGFKLFVLGIGEEKAVGIVDGSRWLTDRGRNKVLTKLNPDKLAMMAKHGKGYYFKAAYQANDTTQLLAALQNQHQVAQSNESVRVWYERFYLLVIVMLFLLLYVLVWRLERTR